MDLTVDIEGLRFVYLTRFIADISSFLSEHFGSLIKSSFSSLNSTIDMVADKQRGDNLSPDDLASMGSISSSSDGSGDESSEDDIAGNAFFEYPIPDLDPDAILDEYVDDEDDQGPSRRTPCCRRGWRSRIGP